MQKQTKPTKKSEVERLWHLVDLRDKILGRGAVDIALLLMGKHKPYFVRHLDCGDFVVIINADKVKTTGKREEQKVYTRYSGYPGGLRRESLGQLRNRRPTEVIRHAVLGMLPKNRLRDRMLARLHIFAGEEHPYKDKIKDQNGRTALFSQARKSKIKNESKN